MSKYLESIFNLKDKVVVVTGSCGQLGKSICQSFSKVGSKVIGIDLDIEKNKVGGVMYEKVDITDNQSVSNLFDIIVEKYDSFDILINNAGVSVFEPFEERDEKSLDWVYDVNLKGTFFCIKHFSRIVDAYNIKNASIVNVGSIYGLISPDYRIYENGDRKNSEIYGATKAGVIQMTKYFSVHLSNLSIRVNCVSPGGIYNPDYPQQASFIEKYSDRNPMNRMADVDEIVGAILYLSSSSSSYTNGHNLIVDGGMSAW